MDRKLDRLVSPCLEATICFQYAISLISLLMSDIGILNIRVSRNIHRILIIFSYWELNPLLFDILGWSGWSGWLGIISDFDKGKKVGGGGDFSSLLPSDSMNADGKRQVMIACTILSVKVS